MKFKDTVIIAFLLWITCAWFTHVFVALKEEQWGFLVAGALLVPIAIMHGTGVWLGFW